MSSEAALRKHVVDLLRGGGAHLGFEEAMRDLPARLRGVKPPGAAHTAWQLVEHMRIAQSDILEFCRNPRYLSPKFPAGYWPTTQAPPDNAAWKASLAEWKADLEALCGLVADSSGDVFAVVNHPEAEAHHTLLREALVVADHNSYHLGQLVMLRRLLGAWKGSKFSV